MLEKFRIWLLKPTIDRLHESFDRQLQSLYQQVRLILVDEREKLIQEHQRQLEAVQPLRDAINTLESYGIRRKFGGVIDIDFDKLCHMLDPDSLHQLEKVLRDHRKKDKVLQ